MKLFLDTSFFYYLFKTRHAEAKTIYLAAEKKFSSQYVIKEFRRVLLRKGVSPSDIEEFISDIRKKCILLPPPSKERREVISIQDRSDAPIVVCALEAEAVLVTFDRKLAREAKRYVETMCLKK